MSIQTFDGVGRGVLIHYWEGGEGKRVKMLMHSTGRSRTHDSSTTTST